MTTTYEGFCSCLDSGDPSPDCGIGRHREEAIRRRRPVTTTDPATDTITQLAEALAVIWPLAVIGASTQGDIRRAAAALLPAVDRIARTRAAHELDAAAAELLKGAVVSPAWLHGKWLTDRAAALRAEP